MPALSTVHIDTFLTNMSVMYKNANYITEQVLPVVPVEKRTGKYATYTKEDFLTGSQVVNGKPRSLRRPGTQADEIDYTNSNGSFACEEYALKTVVPDALSSIADAPLQPEIDAAVLTSEKILLDQEILAAALVGTYATFASSNKVTLTTGGTGTSWASYASANSLPFTDIKNGKLAVIAGIAREANKFLLSVDLARTLADHPLVKDLIKYTNGEALTMSGLPKILRGLRVIEGAQQKNTAAAGVAYSGGNIWRSDTGTNKSLGLIFYGDDSPNLRSVTLGWTFEAPDDATGARGLSVRRWRDEDRKGTKIESAMTRDWGLVTALAGYHIAGGTD